MIKIGLIVNNFDVGGLENVVLSLLNKIDRKIFDLYVICLNGIGEQCCKLEIPLEKCLILKKDIVRLGPISFDLKAIKKIRAFIVKNEIQLIHAHNAAPLVYAGFARLYIKKMPFLLYSEHNQIYSATKFSNWKFKFYIHFADHIIAISEDLKVQLRNQFRAKCPMTLIYNGIDEKKFSDRYFKNIKKELGIPENKLLGGCGVVLSRQKGMKYLLEAISIVKKRSFDNVYFLIAGDGPLRISLEKKVKDLGISDYIRFLGYRSDMPTIIKNLDFYILPSLWEGLPLSLIEAMAMKKPIICTSVGGNMEIVENEVNGIVIPPADPVALANSIIRMIKYPHFLYSLSNNNRKRFESKFTQQKMITSHEKLYKKLLQR